MPALAIPVGPRLARVLEIALRSRRSVLLEGETGVGKSELVAQVAARLDRALAVLDLSLLEPTDLAGVPQVANGRTGYAVPEFLPTEGRGILLLEELSRAEIATRQPALQLLTTRRLHSYELPPGWAVWATTNPAGEDYHLTPLDAALRSRFLVYRVRAERRIWIEWGVQAGIHPAVLQLGSSCDRLLDHVPPRVWSYVSAVLHSLTPEELHDEGLLFDLLSGTLGAEWVELLGSVLDGLDFEAAPDPRRVLATYDGDAALRAIVRGHRTAGRTDRLESLTRQMEETLAGDLAQLVRDRAVRLEAFEAVLADLPGDLRERLQVTSAKHPAALHVLGVHPKQILSGYIGSRLAVRVRVWRSDPLRRHRLAALANALVRHLRRARGTGRRAPNTAPSPDLDLFLSQIGDDLAQPVRACLAGRGRARAPRVETRP